MMYQCGPNWSQVTCPPCSSLCKSWIMKWRWTFTWTQGTTTIHNLTVQFLAGAKSPSMFEVGFSLGCEVMFMNVCAEGRNTASTDWMSPSLFTAPLRDDPPLTPEWDPWQQCWPFCHFLVLFILLQSSSRWYQWAPKERVNIGSCSL